MAAFRTLDDLDGGAIRGQRVLVRADLNVPMREGAVSDATRIDRVAPTLLALAEKGARVIILSHFGRPKGKRVPAMSLEPVVGPLSEALGGRAVGFASDCVGPVAAAAVAALGDGEFALLENLRFHPGEEANDEAFAAALAALGDLYVNDAFSTAHRAHASTTGIARHLPALAGRLMQAELEALENALERPEHPLVAVVGGAKVSSKLALLGNLIAKVDRLVIGGAMANTFLQARGSAVGKSLCEADQAATARQIAARAEAAGCSVILPVDAVIAREFKAGAPTETVAIDAVPAEAMILDLGPASVALIIEALRAAKTLVWNGPLGAFEVPPFDRATTAAAQAAAALTRAGTLLSVAGGGDTVAALRHAGVVEQFSYVSTAGGAFLDWREGKTLPGVAALHDAA